MTDQSVVVSHEMSDEDLDWFRADASMLLRTAREICPTVCMPACEHPLKGAVRVIRNPAVSDLTVEVSFHTRYPTGGVAFLDLRMHGRTAFFKIPIKPESIEAAVHDLPGFVLDRAHDIDVIANTTTYRDEGYTHLEDIAVLSWILGGEGSSIILPTPWSGARLAPWETPPNIGRRLADMIRQRVGERVEISTTPENGGCLRHEITFERVDARNPGIVEAMRTAKRWDVDHQAVQ